MNDLISRQDAIRWVKTECNPYGKPTLDFESGKNVIEHLEQMPSAQQWIPCSERLPAQTGEYLVTVYCTKNVFFIDKFDYMPTSDGWVDPETAVDWNDYVIAWMPLPKPYKKG